MAIVIIIMIVMEKANNKTCKNHRRLDDFYTPAGYLRAKAS
jgi:hypothetical protein